MNYFCGIQNADSKINVNTTSTITQSLMKYDCMNENKWKMIHYCVMQDFSSSPPPPNTVT